MCDSLIRLRQNLIIANSIPPGRASVKHNNLCIILTISLFPRPTTSNPIRTLEGNTTCRNALHQPTWQLTMYQLTWHHVANHVSSLSSLSDNSH